ncbi:MAG: E3 binding domain-containing protein, partial [Thermaceae bacterium]
MEEPKITPLARRLAEENGIDWRKLQGSGPDGAIVERDVLAFLAKVMAGEVDLPPAPEPPPPPSPNPSDLERAMNLLAKEGVQPEEVLPGVPKSTEPSSETLDELEGLLDLDLELEEELSKEVEPALLTWPEHTLPQEETESLPLWGEEMLSSSTLGKPLRAEPPARGTAPEALGIAPGSSPAPA